ncbi:MAG: cytochrome C [Bacteroidetes bacterium 4572_77]|nr:MAG: cytochrome C [Bacteroidetes bacterium 4572_77]
MKTLKQLRSVVLLIILGAILMAFVAPQDQKIGGTWDIPAKYLKMENSYADDASLLKVGKMLYSKHCKSCHGSEGLGDGNKADQLETNPGDFTSDEFKEQSDGKLYFKSFIGRDEMPNFEKKIPDEEDQWAVIMYIRTME